MSEEKKEECCSSSKACGCGCCKGVKLLVGLLLGAFIFASGMWFARAHCHCHMGDGKYCPFSTTAPVTK
jgi:hypothetical protein